MTLKLDQPVPFEIVEQELGGVVARQASNGTMRITVLDGDAQLFRRRAVSGLAAKPAAETILPLVNQLAGDLLKELDMPAEQVAARLLALAGQVPLTKPRNAEWVVAKLDGVYVTTDGVDVFVTREDLQ